MGTILPNQTSIMDKNNDRRDELNPLNERELIRRCRSGEESAYVEFYQEYSSRVYTLSCRLLRDQEWAKDAVQEIFLKAFRGLTSFNEQSKIATWLYRITINQCQDMLREQSRRPITFYQSAGNDENAESRIEQMPDSKSIPSREQESRELRQRIMEAINRLPLEFRETIYLKEFEGLSYEEIAQILACRLGTVKSRIFRARELLQVELQDLYKEIKGEE